MAVRKWLVIGLALSAAGMAILVRGNFRGLPPCPLHSTTGLYCPGCGVTRAGRALMHGDLGAALQMNAVAILLMPLMAFVMIREIAAWGWQRPEVATRNRWPLGNQTWFRSYHLRHSA